jgi:hypothetical protein
MARTTAEPLLLPQPPPANAATRAWGTVAAVLVLLVLLLRPSNLFGAPPPPERVDLTLLAGATEKGSGTLPIRVSDLAGDCLIFCMNYPSSSR